MCNFLSAIVTRQGTILHHPLTDSHSELIAHFRLKEGRSGQNFARVEFSPSRKHDVPQYLDIDQYSLRIDEDFRPSWFDEDLEHAVTQHLAGVVKNMIVNDARAILLGGAWIIGSGAKVEVTKEARIITILEDGTVQAINGGTVKAIRGGTVEAINGGTVEAIWGGTVQAINGGTVKAIRGGTVKAIWGGTVKAIRGGTVKAIWRGTVQAIRGDAEVPSPDKIGRHAKMPADWSKTAKA